jgi:hypothetical protein
MCFQHLGIASRVDKLFSAHCLAKQLNPQTHTHTYTHTHTHTYTHTHDRQLEHIPSYHKSLSWIWDTQSTIARPHPVKTTFNTRQSLLPGKSDLTSYHSIVASSASRVLTHHLVLRPSWPPSQLDSHELLLDAFFWKWSVELQGSKQ